MDAANSHAASTPSRSASPSPSASRPGSPASEYYSAHSTLPHSRAASPVPPSYAPPPAYAPPASHTPPPDYSAVPRITDYPHHQRAFNFMALNQRIHGFNEHRGVPEDVAAFFRAGGVRIGDRPPTTVYGNIPPELHLPFAATVVGGAAALTHAAGAGTLTTAAATIAAVGGMAVMYEGYRDEVEGAERDRQIQEAIHSVWEDTTQ